MGKRRSMGSDPLDWVGKPSEAPRTQAPAGGMESVGIDGGGPEPGISSGGDFRDGEMLPSTTQGGGSMERQLLLVDSVLKSGAPRARLNQVLWTVLIFLTVVGMGLLFFQETRRQWNERLSSMEGTIDRIEKEKGRNEQLLQQVIVEKDELIREKQGTISKIESIQQGLAEELHRAREEAVRLKDENHSILNQFLDLPRKEPAPEPPRGPETPPVQPVPGVPGSAAAPPGAGVSAPATAPSGGLGSRPEGK